MKKNQEKLSFSALSGKIWAIYKTETHFISPPFTFRGRTFGQLAQWTQHRISWCNTWKTHSNMNTTKCWICNLFVYTLLPLLWYDSFLSITDTFWEDLSFSLCLMNEHFTFSLCLYTALRKFLRIWHHIPEAYGQPIKKILNTKKNPSRNELYLSFMGLSQM